MPGRVRLAGIFLFALTTVFAQSGRRDPVFSQFSFDQWRAEGKESLLHSSLDLIPAELSPFQRLIAGIRIGLEGPELGDHHALILVQFEDAKGAVWQTHSSLGRQRDFVQQAFVLPGDYSVSVALFDPVTFRHGFAQKKLHVPALKNEPLPGAWDGLPLVEFLQPDVDLSDSWFLPSVTSGIKLPIETHRPVHIDALINTTASDRVSDSLGEFRRNMNAVIPALKVLSEMNLSHGTMDVAFLDLMHRRDVSVSNWADMRRFLMETNPGVIDIHALDSRRTMRSFLLDRIAKRLGGEPARVVIVLSGPAFLSVQEPVSGISLASGPERRIFYIRCRLIPHSVLAPRPRPRPGARPQPARFGMFQLPLDDLEQPLEGSGATLFDVITPEQFRRVLAAIIGQISRL